jgi:hypothetical protein
VHWSFLHSIIPFGNKRRYVGVMSAMSNIRNPSDHDVLEGTGRHPDEWFAFLDMAGAAKWKHSLIVGWFATNAGHLSVEWAESVAARYAAARGMSEPE